MKARFGLYYSMTWIFAKKLLTLGMHYEAIPDPELTLPKGLLPDQPP